MIKKRDVCVQYDKIFVACAIFLPLLCGISETMANVVSFLELAILLLLYNKDEFWVITPVLFLFFPQLLLLGKSLSLFNVYCIICLYRLIRDVRYIRIWENLPMLMLYGLMLYAAIVCMFWRTIRESAVLALQSTALLGIALSVKKRPHIMNRIRRVFVICCMNAAIYGVLYRNIIGEYEVANGLIQYNVRYAGTAADPNYMAFFYCLGMCYVLFANHGSKSFAVGGAIALFAATALTGSLTALITIAVILGLRIIFGTSTKKSTRCFWMLLIAAAAGFFVWYLFTDGMEIPLLGTYKSRILERLDYIRMGKSMNDITSGRSNIQDLYMKHFYNDTILRILFGGYQINTQGIDSCVLVGTDDAPHNSYIDVLMTGGFFGLAIFAACLFINLYRGWKRWRNGDAEGMIGMVSVFSTMVFMAGLSVFPAANYMYFLMI